jgi:hypothetical protein
MKSEEAGQTATLHLYKLRRDEKVHIVALFLPAVEHAAFETHVPGDVEALVERMLAVAREAGAEVAS